MFKGLILFGQFFTKLYLPFAIDDPMDQFRKNIQYLTAFGFVFGALEAVIFWALTFIFPLWFCWLSYWILDGLLTGGFHLDALADTADGLFSARKPEKIFAIMKDSRLGTMGSLALLYYYGIVVGLGVILSQQVPSWRMVLLVATLTMLTKTGLSLLFIKMNYVGTPHGLSLIWVNVATWRVIVAQVITVIIIAGCLSVSGLIGYLVMLICAGIYHHKITQLLGGFSGDTLGAFACLAPLIFLLAFTIAVRCGLPI